MAIRIKIFFKHNVKDTLKTIYGYLSPSLRSHKPQLVTIAKLITQAYKLVGWKNYRKKDLDALFLEYILILLFM